MDNKRSFTEILLWILISVIFIALVIFAFVAIAQPQTFQRVLDRQPILQESYPVNAQAAPAAYQQNPQTTPQPTPAQDQASKDMPVFVPGIYGSGATVGVSTYEPYAPPTPPATTSVFPPMNTYDTSTVIAIQSALTANGFATTVDGGYGPETATSVRLFQSWKRLGAIDGVTGTETAEALGISLSVARNYHYEADLERIASTSPSDFLYYITTYNGATLTQYHRENGVWRRVGTTPVTFSLSTDLSRPNSLGVHVLNGGFPFDLFTIDSNYANILRQTCPNGTQLVIDDRNITF